MALVNISPASPDPSAQSRLLRKTVTFTGASGLGQSGSNTVWFTQSGGLVVVDEIAGRVTTNLAGATATITLGIVGSTGLFVAATTATLLVTTAAIWVSTTPTDAGLALPAAVKQIVINANIVSAVAVADITSGVLEMNVRWHPLTPGAALA